MNGLKKSNMETKTIEGTQRMSGFILSLYYWGNRLSELDKTKAPEAVRDRAGIRMF